MSGNFWEPNHVSVQADGLHLKIARDAALPKNDWAMAEAVLALPLGHGEYIFTVQVLDSHRLFFALLLDMHGLEGERFSGIFVAVGPEMLSLLVLPDA